MLYFVFTILGQDKKVKNKKMVTVCRTGGGRGGGGGGKRKEEEGVEGKRGKKRRQSIHKTKAPVDDSNNCEYELFMLLSTDFPLIL